MEASIERLEAIDGVGSIMSEQIYEYLHNDITSSRISAILHQGVRLIPPKSSRSLEMAGKTFVFTGKLIRIKRGEAIEAAESVGGKVSGSVSSRTKFLVVGEDPGSKLQKAKNLRVKLLSESEFINKIKQ